MTLKEQLDLIKGKDVKIGFRVSFIYCEINDDNIENVLNELSENEFKKNKNELKKAKNYLNNFDMFWKNKICNAKKKFIKDNPYADRKQIKTFLNKLEENKKIDLQKSQDRVLNLSSIIKNWIPFINREVLEVYNSIVDKETIIIHCEGQEFGAFWDKEEYQKVLKGEIIEDENYDLLEVF